MSNFPTGWSAAELHEQDEEDELDFEADIARDAIIFAIDVSGRMLERTSPSGGSSVLSALKAILTLMKKKVISAPKDMMGIIMFNTEVTKGIGTQEFERMYVLQDVLELDAPMVQNLKDIISNAEEEPSSLSNLLRPDPERPHEVGQVLYVCNQLLRSRAHCISTKRIYLVTDVEDPFPLDVNKEFVANRHTCQTLARDCAEMHFTVTPFFVVYDEQSFDVEKFHKEFLVHHAELDADNVEKYTIRDIGSSERDQGWDHFLQTTGVRPPPKRSAFSIPFIIGEGLEIGINGYNVISEAKKSAAIKVDLQGAVPREIQPQTTYHDADAGELLDPKKHIKTYFSMGAKDASAIEKKIVFEDDEREELRTVGQKPGLRLLGFVNPDTIPVEHFCRHPLFIYPSDSTYIGSIRLFAAMHASMLKKGVAGLGLLVARKSSTPQHVLMLAQQELRSPEGVQMEAPGMHLIQLAYADDIRSPPDAILKNGTTPASRNPDPDAERPDIDLMKKIISRLRFKNGYAPSLYENPALHYHYACLESIALQEPPPEPVDTTLPKYHNIEKRAGDMIQELRGMIDANELVRTHSTRIKDAEGKVLTSKKKRVAEDATDAPEESRVIALFKAEEAQKLKRDEMMAYLDSVNYSYKKSANKSILSETISTYLTEKGLI